MNLLCCTVIDQQGAVRFVGHGEIRRSGRASVFDGRGHTSATFSYRLPKEWALAPMHRGRNFLQGVGVVENWSLYVCYRL